MEDKVILEGCEKLCLGFEGSDYVACPLPPEEQKECRQRLQYEAGEQLGIAKGVILKVKDMSLLNEGDMAELNIQAKAYLDAVKQEGYQAGRETERAKHELSYCEKHKLYFCDCCPDCFEEIGRREVVEWVENHGGSLDGCRPEWLAQLKEWGL